MKYAYFALRASELRITAHICWLPAAAALRDIIRAPASPKETLIAFPLSVKTQGWAPQAEPPMYGRAHDFRYAPPLYENDTVCPRK